MNDAPAPSKWIGQSVERLEDPPLVTGRARFAGDINFARQLHMRVVRSNHAHANITSIYTDSARMLPGVFAVWTAEDIADIPPIDFREGPIEKLAPYRQPVLAVHKVRYVGEPIAVVFAEDPYIAEDAADIVTMEVEELPPLLDARDEPGEFSFARDTEATVLHQGYGDVEAVFKTAPHIVELKLTSGRHSGVPLETRGAIGRYDASRDVLELHGAAKVPHRNKELIARMLNRPPSSVQCFESHVGGGFGIRGEIYPEDILVCVAAMRLERPVKWIEDRREHLIAANHSRNQHHHIRAAVADDGEILAIDDEIFHDNGAYVRTHATRVAMMTCGVLPGPYRVPGAYRATCHFRLTNKTPAATYRAPGRFETTFVRERLVDAIAHQLRLDPIHVRRRNAVTVNEMPFKRPLEALGEEIHFDSGDYHALLDTTLKHVEWAKLNQDLAARRENGEMVGVGLAMFVEKAGLGPADGVRIQVDTSGAVEVITGGASIGQGFETVMAQVAADCLGTDYKKMRVIHGQTDRIEQGIGAHASRATVMTASATRVAALKVRDKALNMAADLLQSPADTLDIVNGEVVIAGRKSGPSISLGKIAAALGPSSKLRGEREPGLSAEGWFYADHQVYPYGNHLAVVKVDPDTGFVKVLRYVVAYDVGRALNPALVKAQIAGGFAQGLGGALMEEFTYNERGDPLSSTFGDYLLPTIKDVPDIEIILTEDYPTPLNPLGIKGAGESGVNGVGAAIATAIDDAIGIPGAITELPVTPQRLKAIIDGKQ
ncbi:MAG: xanthine dehydrogenase family protein molybdopterin-binding subunit [Xanthobacteraceae bacterium]|nr:xanthine dehydrogenase family protein molybdopterin-binding subunit [Xanthobacteraceae bacterium]